MVNVQIRESEVEDVFAQYPRMMKDALGLEAEIFLVARQMLLPSGRIDLMYSHRSELLLIELKVVPCRQTFIEQIAGYRADMVALQSRDDFIDGDIRSILLCPDSTQHLNREAERQDIRIATYSPEEILLEFYQHAPLDTRNLSITPADHGIWRIGIINQTLSLATEMHTTTELSASSGLSPKTIGNRMRFAAQLGLAQREGQVLKLTSAGADYVQARDPLLPDQVLSKSQAKMLRRLILADPFFSGVTFGILTMIECIFELSRNTYPVPIELVSDQFINTAGLHYRWNSEKAIKKGVQMYTNYAADLGLVGKIGDNYFVTPSGLEFVLLLSMHKSLRLVETALH